MSSICVRRSYDLSRAFKPMILLVTGAHDEDVAYIAQPIEDKNSDFLAVHVAEFFVLSMTDTQAKDIIIDYRTDGSELFCEDAAIAQWETDGGR
jgi:hypothetical protein